MTRRRWCHADLVPADRGNVTGLLGIGPDIATRPLTERAADVRDECYAGHRHCDTVVGSNQPMLSPVTNRVEPCSVSGTETLNRRVSRHSVTMLRNVFL
ncbi:hypothetical protein C8039_14820 [Halogeometricum sp. wsp3]|nr:hypothetical protein C8039_14820 [Halogeometricum sp. wsp3]